MNPKNRHKFVSLMMLTTQIASHIAAEIVAARLKRATLYVDNEDFRMPRECAWLIKWYFAAALQGSGMHAKLSGNSPFETAFRGNIRTRVNCRSERYAGIQFADIVARAGRRRLFRLLP